MEHVAVNIENGIAEVVLNRPKVNAMSRALLLLQSLAELSVAKGVVTREEIAAMAERVDMEDGVADGKLDPAVMRPEQEESKDE